MRAVFVQLQCQPGKTYEVADTLFEKEIVSELYSTSGEYDLLMKIYVDSEDDIGKVILKLTEGRGADVAIEAVGTPGTFELCADLVRAGGHVANVGVHGAPATLHLERLWIRDVTITTGLVDTRTTPLLMRLLEEGKVSVEGLCTHRFGLHEMQDAYDAFSRPEESGALKVVLFGDEMR